MRHPWIVVFVALSLLVLEVTISWRQADSYKVVEQSEPDPDYELDTDEPAYGSPRSSKWPTARAHWVMLNPECAMCGTTKNPHVHHKLPFSVRPDLELDPKNFVTLCGPKGNNCHFRWGHDFDGPLGPTNPSWKTYNPNIDADIKKYGVKENR